MKKQKYSKEEQTRAAFVYVLGKQLILKDNFFGFCALCNKVFIGERFSYRGNNFEKALPSFYNYYGNQKHPVSNLPRMVHLFWFSSSECKGSVLTYRLKLLKEYYNF